MDGEMKERFIRAMCYPPYPVAQYNDRKVHTLKEWLDTGGSIE